MNSHYVYIEYKCTHLLHIFIEYSLL